MYEDASGVKYNPVEDSQSESETLLSESRGFEASGARPRTLRPRALLSLCISLSLFAAVALGVLLGSHWPFNPAEICTDYVSQYSPLRKDVDISYDAVRFNGSLLKENIFRQPAGPEVDKAWESLGVNYRSLVVPADQAERSGLLPDQVKINQKYGGGFPANVEGLHHLHCLNLLRQSLYYNFDYYHAKGKGPFANEDHILRFHVTHCLDIIRQQLMCTIDIGVLGQVWWNPSYPEAYVDFNTKHKCRNFDAIRQWAYEHQMPTEVPPDFLEPPKDGDTVYETIP